ncbi:MAG TPA: O-antigen ligase domain-containing protein [Xanthobacteraceae bacterium]|nr:O-antigen ligase domain-containing protein [Xanthobacteraceae bacterium]
MSVPSHAGFEEAGPHAALVVGARSIANAFFVLAILLSPVVFIEPAPYEGLVGLTGLALCFTPLKLHRSLAVLLGLIAVWAAGGALALPRAMGDSQAVVYYLVSIYLALTALIFALFFSTDTMQRLSLLEKAYIAAAVIASLVGTAGYFSPVQGMRDLLLENSRVRATFKDPNVFGPFLVLPMLFVIQNIIYRGIRLRYLLAGGAMLIGLLLCFSRGAWGHAGASALLMLGLMFWTNRSPAFRLRLVALSGLTVVLLAVLVAVALSFSAVSDMFAVRANLVNYYDAGETGRFGRQLEGFLAIFDLPNGLGPRQFRLIYGNDPHNIYLAALYAYGWLGGIAYSALVVVTLVVGARALLVASPWQPRLIAIYATFVGVMAEGFIIDTDHWRHYFLLMGAIWGLFIATQRHNTQRLAAERYGALAAAAGSNGSR